MADPVELAGAGIGGVTVGGLLVGLVKVLGSRNINALDKTLAELATAVKELRAEVQALREAHVGLAKDIGGLQKENERLRERVDKLSEHWRAQFEEHRKMVHDRMTQATHAMLETVENIGKGKKAR